MSQTLDIQDLPLWCHKHLMYKTSLCDVTNMLDVQDLPLWCHKHACCNQLPLWCHKQKEWERARERVRKRERKSKKQTHVGGTASGSGWEGDGCVLRGRLWWLLHLCGFTGQHSATGIPLSRLGLLTDSTVAQRGLFGLFHLGCFCLLFLLAVHRALWGRHGGDGGPLHRGPTALNMQELTHSEVSMQMPECLGTLHIRSRAFGKTLCLCKISPSYECTAISSGSVWFSSR